MKNVLVWLYALVLSLFSALAHAAAQDYSGVQTALMAEIAAALVVALVIFGAVGGISVAFRLIKKAFSA